MKQTSNQMTNESNTNNTDGPEWQSLEYDPEAEHVHLKITDLSVDSEGGFKDVSPRERAFAVSPEDSNILSSVRARPKRVVDGLIVHDERTVHSPALDIDIPIKLVPSSTPGHHHLYIDKELSWWQYQQLLMVLADCGIIEKGFACASIERKATFLRKPGVTK